MMKPEDQEKICTICQCEMSNIGSLETCSHQFCFECIKHWGTNCANTCPLCKKRFNVIKHTDSSGQSAEFKVLNRNQGYTGDNAILIQIDDSMDYCYVCGSDRDPHLMMICDLCDFMVAHTTCCGFGNNFPEDWICRECENLINVNESEYDSEEDESYTSSE